MTEIDTNNLLRSIAAVYPHFMDGRDAALTLNIWHTVFQDTPADLVFNALMMYISNDTKGYPPMPGNINQCVDMIQAKQTGEPDAMEAWAHVQKAIQNGLYGYRGEYAKLTPLEQRAVGSAEMLKVWALTDEREVNTVICSNFQKSFRDIQKTQSCIDHVPVKLQEMINTLLQKQASSNIVGKP